MSPIKAKITLRIEKEALDKLRYVADNNFRTINKEVIFLIKTHIAEYEESHGRIVLDDTT